MPFATRSIPVPLRSCMLLILSQIDSSNIVPCVQVLMHLPEDIVTTWASSMRPKDALLLPQTAINVWCAKTYPLKMDLKTDMLGFPQLVRLASALRCVPKLQELSLRLRTHKKSHGKAYRDAICVPPAYMFKDDYSAQQTGCQVCSKCKDDERLSVLAAAMPCLSELRKLELVECLFDYGSARQFMWLLAPLMSLEVLKIGDGGGSGCSTVQGGACVVQLPHFPNLPPLICKGTHGTCFRVC